MRGLIFSLVFPYLTYCNTVWGTTFNTRFYNPWFELKNVLFVLLIKIPDTSLLLRKINVLNFENINSYFVFVYIYKNSYSFEATAALLDRVLIYVRL